jgi:hypothetical protein
MVIVASATADLVTAIYFELIRTTASGQNIREVASRPREMKGFSGGGSLRIAELTREPSGSGPPFSHLLGVDEPLGSIPLPEEDHTNYF